MASTLQPLRDALYDAVSSSISLDKPIGVAFSGGVDSSLLAKICADLGADLTLLTIGFAGSPDIAFSRIIAADMRLSQKMTEIGEPEFEKDARHIMGLISCKNSSHIENCIAYRQIARLARENGIGNVISANGLDELFCGYNSYRAAFDLGEDAVLDMMDQKLKNELELVAEIRTAAGEMQVEVNQPFLSRSFVAYAKEIPVNEKIHGSDDLLRKHIIRKVAIEIGVPEGAAIKPKKALQYGSLIHKHFKKMQRGGSLDSALSE